MHFVSQQDDVSPDMMPKIRNGPIPLAEFMRVCVACIQRKFGCFNYKKTFSPAFRRNDGQSAHPLGKYLHKIGLIIIYANNVFKLIVKLDGLKCFCSDGIQPNTDFLPPSFNLRLQINSRSIVCTPMQRV